jgi:hypothetical protein
MFSHVCCKCFYQDVAYICNGFQVFLQVFQTHVLSVSSVFRRMLQVLHLDVSKVDQMFHILQCDPPVAAAGGARGVRWGVDATWGSGGAHTPCGCPSKYPGASTVVR